MPQETPNLPKSIGIADSCASAEEISGRISSWRDFSDRVVAAMVMAATEPVPITLSDRNFEQWPLGRSVVVDAFQQWVLGSAGEIRCSVLAADFDCFMRTHPRWVNWRRLWAHRVSCRQVSEDLASSVPTMLVLQGRLALRVVEPRVGRGFWTREPAVISDWLLEVDAILQQSFDALPTTTLGL